MRNQLILGTYITPITYTDACVKVYRWQQKNECKFVCAANVHMIMEAYDSPLFQKVINDADLVTPDGMPLVWMLRKMGYPNQERVYGPSLTLRLLRMASNEDIPIGIFGSTPTVLNRLLENIKNEYPQLKVVYACSPPFKQHSEEEDLEIIENINTSGARILFVGLGCPKQEYWMHDHRGKIKSVMLGVGAAFDFIAGVKPQAPLWIQKIGFEWLFRLVSEPKRLWKRYFHHNPRFLYHATLQLIKSKFHLT